MWLLTFLKAGKLDFPAVTPARRLCPALNNTKVCSQPQLDPPLTTCLHRGTFVFHHKGSTVGDNMETGDRAKFHAPG